MLEYKLEQNKKPPIYEKCVAQFGADWDAGTIFTYGKTIYCKYGLPAHKLAHEIVHTLQQGDDPKTWWEKYFDDTDFRLNQEIEAYETETKFLRKHNKDRTLIFNIIQENAKMLSSQLYGSIISYGDALKILMKK